ncbi:hypothetical protein [Mycoplasmoides genitalium]|uniref:hypothetical protein n=1 Tax=Mycoplasmoides genitalium TaxID=2097 RepID=UPI0040556491
MEYHNLNNQVVKESLEVESSSSFDPTQGLQKDSPVKDSSKTGEKLEESSMSGATSTRKALKVEKQSGSTDSLLKNDFAKKPLKHKDNSGEVKLEAEKDFPQGKVWKPLLTTEQIKDNRGMGMPTPPPLQLLLPQPPSPLFLTSMLGLNQWSLNI